jgi:predicted acetyltransferase
VIELRIPTAGDTLAFLQGLSGPFFFDIEDPDSELARFSVLFEPERGLMAYDGDTLAGTVGTFTLSMTVPGGRVACGGTTMVSVQPTHRRRGVLRRMMTAHLEGVRERGEVMAALWSSDSAIYGRFGYGMASVFAEATIDRDHAGFHRLAPAPGRVRMVEADEATSVMRPVYDRACARRPGMFDRGDGWWTRRVRDEPRDRDGASAYRYAVVDGDHSPTGYAQYRLKEGSWAERHGDAVVRVVEIVADDAEAAASLWSFLLGHDLVGRIETGRLPEDDALFSLLAGPRRSAPVLTDQLFVRLIDVPAALEGRRFAADGRVSFTVGDPVGGVASYLLEIDGGVATCCSAQDGDIHLDLEDLSGCYLGRARFRALARAGRLRGADAALGFADRAFSWDPAPWCQEIF